MVLMIYNQNFAVFQGSSRLSLQACLLATKDSDLCAMVDVTMITCLHFSALHSACGIIEASDRLHDEVIVLFHLFTHGKCLLENLKLSLDL